MYGLAANFMQECDFIWKTERQGQSYMVMAEIINLIIPLDTVIPITRIRLNPFSVQ